MIEDRRGAGTIHKEEIMRQAKAKLLMACVAFALLLVACGGGGGGGGIRATIGGTVSGLGSGLSVTLLNNGGGSLVVTGNGAFTIAKVGASYTPYAVTVSVQPSWQTCAVANGSGLVDATGASVENIAVTCTYTASLGGVVSGLAAGESVTVKNKNGIPHSVDATLSVAANGEFVFPGVMEAGLPYNVSVSTQPAGQNCTVSKASGAVVAKSLALVQIDCAFTASVGGVVSGLATGGTVIVNNYRVPVSVTANGQFVFPGVMVAGATYAVSVGGQPAGQTCKVTSSNASGPVVANSIAWVQIDCASP